VARLLPPESAALDRWRRTWVSAGTLERWRSEALSRPRVSAWTAAAGFEAVLTTAAMDEAEKSAWCRKHGVYAAELEQWRRARRGAGGARGGACQSAADQADRRKRIKELERDLLRKDRALAETAALLVLSKKVAAIFNKGEAE
jgi:transposase